jgi:hypothetical protein
MSQKIKILCLIIILAALFQNAAAGQSNELIKLKNKIESKYYTFDSKGQEMILSKVENLIRSDTSWQLKYYSGFLHISIGKIYYNIDSDIAYDHFDDAVDRLLEIPECSRSAEVKALLSSAYGKKSSLSTFQAIILGIKAKSWIEEAFEMDNNNQKVLLTAAVHLMHAPAAFGGDKDRARELLLKCLKLNAKQSLSESVNIHWAEDAEIYAYLAQLEILLENKAKAKEYMKTALKFQASYGFVIKDLKPQLEKIDN